MARASELAARELLAEVRAIRDRLTRVELVPEPVAWAEGVSGMTLDPWQREFMRGETSLELLNCCRQSGKTTVTSLRSAYRARHTRRRIGVLSPTLDKSLILYDRAKEWLLRDGATFARLTAIRLEVAGGGVLISFPGDRPDLAARGETLDDLVVDEASRIKTGVIVSASPTQATRPDATETWLSTPAGARGAFHEQWQDVGMPWKRTRVTADMCSRISRDFLARRKRMIGEAMFRQEFYCEFVTAPGALFAADDLAAMFELPVPDVALPEADEVGGLDF